jgi:hypothetical protein
LTFLGPKNKKNDSDVEASYVLAQNTAKVKRQQKQTTAEECPRTRDIVSVLKGRD